MAAPPPRAGLRKTGFDILLTFGRQILAGLMQFGLVLLLGRVLGADGMGAYAVALLLPTLLSQLLNFGLVSANVYFVSSRQADATTVWVVSRDLGLVLGVVGVGLGGLLASAGGEVVFPSVPAEALLLAMLIFPFSLMTGMVTSLFQAWEDFRSFNLLVLVQPAVALLAGLVLLAVSGFSLLTVLAATAFSHFCGLVIGLARLRSYVPLLASGRARGPYLRIALRYGIKAHLSNIVSFLNYRLDLFLVNLLAGAAAAGIYAAAVRLVELLWLTSQAVSTVITPRLSAMTDDEAGRSRLTTAVGRGVFWVTLLASGALAAVAKPLITGLLGAEFAEAAYVVLMLLPGVVLFSVARVLANDLAARGRVGLNLWLAVGTVAVNALANLILIPGYGPLGAAVATSLAYAVNLVVRLLLQATISNVSPRNLFIPRASDLRRLHCIVKKRRCL